ncbi:MAG: XRE family transcriptional regulator [Pedobacter sp.]|nr:MAG: XRE family transcriptional regulator [Pedobacter sp.]
METNEFNFGGNLRVVRQAKGISQEALALALNLSQTTYSRIESRASLPPDELIAQIATVVEVQKSMLMAPADITDMVPKVRMALHLKEILDTPSGRFMYWVMMIPFVNASFDFVAGLSDGLGLSATMNMILRDTMGFFVIFMIFFWMRRIRKGEG